jgi:hypothetical protein
MEKNETEMAACRNTIREITMLPALVVIGSYLFDRKGSLKRDAGTLADDWEEHHERSIRVGPRQAPVVVTEFTKPGLLTVTSPRGCKTPKGNGGLSSSLSHTPSG